MPSPVSKDNFPVLTSQTSVCQRLGNVLAGYDAMGEFLDWLLNDSGEISDEVLAGFSDRMTPVGTILMYAGVVLPSDNWRVCNGQLVSRTTYQKLFTVMGTVFGNGDGVNTFALPNMTDRFPVVSGGSYSRGQVGGLAEVVLTVEQMPKHTHPLGLNSVNDSRSGGDFKTHPTAGTPLISGEAGGDRPHENLPPYFGIGFIIKVL